MKEGTTPFDFSKHTVFDENLREVPNDREGLKARIATIHFEMATDDETEERVKHLSELGVIHRVLGNLDEAEQLLGEALSLVQEDELEPRYFVIHGIRLAHVWQWQRRFEESTPMFEELVQISLEHKECANLLDFVYQHYGKNLFDQKRYHEALSYFEKAMEIRQKMGNAELISSTKAAIDRTQELLAPETTL